MGKRRPNIVIFNPDQMRADALAHLGNPASITPNLDRIAREDGVSFRNAFCQNPVCVPSRISFFSGLYPHVHGHRTMNHMLHGHESSIFSELKDAGYHVWLNDRNDFLPTQVEGYYENHADEVFQGPSVFTTPRKKTSNPRGEYGDKDYYSFYRGRIEVAEGEDYKSIDDLSIDAALDFITHRDNEDEQPFCLFLGLLYPHPPYQVEEPFFSAIDRSKLPGRIPSISADDDMPSILKTIRKEQMLDDHTEEDFDELRACYLGMCMKIDYQFGLICQALKDAGLYDDTDIYFFSDHGDFTGDYGITEKCQNTFQDCLVNVPFLIKPHKGAKIDPGISDSLVELIDFYATAVEFSGVLPASSHFGKSLKEVLADREAAVRDFVACEGGRLAEENHCSEVPNGLPGKAYEYRPRMKAQLDPVNHTKATMLRTKEFKYVKRLYEKDELYNLKRDAAEIENLVDHPDYQEILTKLRYDQLNWYQRTCDVVPLKEDSRIDSKAIWSAIRDTIQLPDHEKTEINRKIDAGILSGSEFLGILGRYRKQMEDAQRVVTLEYEDP